MLSLDDIIVLTYNGIEAESYVVKLACIGIGVRWEKQTATREADKFYF